MCYNIIKHNIHFHMHCQTMRLQHTGQAQARTLHTLSHTHMHRVYNSATQLRTTSIERITSGLPHHHLTHPPSIPIHAIRIEYTVPLYMRRKQPPSCSNLQHPMYPCEERTIKVSGVRYHRGQGFQLFQSVRHCVRISVGSTEKKA